MRQKPKSVRFSPSPRLSPQNDRSPQPQKAFNNVQVVQDLSFTAPDGAITGLLGSNGAGKTTTLRMICGVLQPDSGFVLIDHVAHAATNDAPPTPIPHRRAARSHRSLSAAHHPRHPATAVLAAGTWILIAAAWIFGLSNRKNTWSPAASTTAAFLDLSIRRTRGNLRAATFGAILYAVNMTFCLTWIFPESGSLSKNLMLSIAGITILFLAALQIYRRKKRTDLRYLLNLQREQEQSN